MRALDWLLLVILSVLWGMTFFFAGVALQELPPLTLVLARVVIAASVLAPVLLLLGYHFPRTREGWLNFAVMAVLNNIVPFGLIFFAQTRIPSGLAAVLNAATPLSALLVGRIFAGDALP